MTPIMSKINSILAPSLLCFLLFTAPTHGQTEPIEVTETSPVPTSATTTCPEENISFEMVTGYVYTAPADMLDSQPGTLMLTDCIDTCQKNTTCRSINYETGLCVLFSSNADDNDGQLTPSQFPVFTIYVQKTCLPSSSRCSAAWSFERVMNHELNSDVRKRGKANSREDCEEMCLSEKEFECRPRSNHLLFPPVIPARLMRSEVAGLVPHCLPLAANTMVCHGTQMWNQFAALREAGTKREAAK
eukprot:maker-scaffold30_size591359-snap-gene-1.14 protein:Tk12752 transcript:maker-scaffold30_size591359-snap-gene-1.14-mRNA-1 annotation:"hypothetical protein Phum_PHUM495760"